MSVFSGIEKHPEQILDQRLSLSLRLPILLHLLLGRTPVRRLAQSLIVVLLVISPLSFSTDKITNFTYECPVSSSHSDRLHRTVAVQRTVAFKTKLPFFHRPGSSLFPAPCTPTIQLISSSFPCRAPPA